MFELQTFILLSIPMLPLIAAAWIAIGFIFGWNRGERGEAETRFVALLAASLTPLLLAGMALYSLWRGFAGTSHLGTWLESGNFHISISLLADPLSLSISLVFSILLLLVTRFSVTYIHREAGFQRFFMVLSLFNSAILWIVLSGDAALTFIGWELAGLSSYLLITYAWQRDIATQNATRAFITNRFGDVGFILALFTALAFLGTSGWEALLAVAQQESSMMVGVIGLGIMTAALIKAAQFPFSAWITRALEGPTPSSAIFYGSVLSHAGIYLLLRIAPLLAQVPLLGYTLILIGLLTIAYAWLSTQAQTDIKTSLIYATLMHTGLMLIEIALGLTTLATVHLAFHAIWRTYQFLHAPSFMQQTQPPAPPPPHWLERSPWLKAAALQRFWLDPVADALLVRPTRKLAQEAQLFDERIIDRITGQPGPSNLIALMSAPNTEAQSIQLESQVGTGSGLLGKLMQNIAEGFEWFENRLVLNGSGNSLSSIANFLGSRAEIVDAYLRQPRYLMVLIAATLAVIL